VAGGSGSEPSQSSRPSAQDVSSVRQNASAHLTSDGDSEPPANVVLLTGPNYSGKSVYLKQIGIIIFLAHVGSFVPANSATIGLTDQILCRVSSRETVSRIQSAFMMELQQISFALSQVTCRSLLLIDEFGKGTEYSDGAGLAYAVIKHLMDLGSERPKVVGATHFHGMSLGRDIPTSSHARSEIFELGLLNPTPNLAFGHMEVRIDTNAPEINDQITYLYKYVRISGRGLRILTVLSFRAGRSTSSFGTW
jgi:DNA mismatch repair protein MSH5